MREHVYVNKIAANIERLNLYQVELQTFLKIQIFDHPKKISFRYSLECMWKIMKVQEILYKIWK